LVSYAGLEEDMVMAMDLSGIRRIYSLVRLSYLGEMFQVEGVRNVPYQSVRGLSSLCVELILLFIHTHLRLLLQVPQCTLVSS
jgi:hypothetical protein